MLLVEPKKDFRLNIILWGGQAEQVILEPWFDILKSLSDAFSSKGGIFDLTRTQFPSILRDKIHFVPMTKALKRGGSPKWDADKYLDGIGKSRIYPCMYISPPLMRR